jgi:predicted MFS family arabinose efflux permease
MTPPETPAPAAAERRSAGTGEHRLILLGCVLFIAASLLGYVAPVYLAFVSERLSLNPTQFGMLAGVDFLGVAIVSLLGPWWATRYATKPWLVATALLICIVGNTTSCFATDFETLFALRLATGLFGSGVLNVVCIVVLTATTNVHRAIGIGLTATVGAGALVIYNTSHLTALSPTFGPMAPVIAAAIIALPFVRWMGLAERKPISVEDRAAQTGSQSRAAIVTALLAQCLWAGGPAAFWAFAQHIAVGRGIKPATVELVLSLGLLGGLLGSIAPIVQGMRWGQLKPVAGTTVAIILAGALYQSTSSVAVLTVAVCAFYAAWNYSFIYQLGIITSLDRTGRFIPIMPATQVFGYSIGPVVAGLMTERLGDAGVFIALSTCVTVGMALLTGAFLLSRRMAASPEGVADVAT